MTNEPQTIRRNDWPVRVLLLGLGCAAGWLGNELLADHWVLHDRGIRINSRTGEAWKMDHTKREWIPYKDGLAPLPPQPDPKFEALEKKYGVRP